MHFLAKLKSIISKWAAFFQPKRGWKERLLRFKGGQAVWPVPYDEKAPKVIPWPLDWIPHRQLIATDDEAAQARGFVFVDVVCVDSGKAAPLGVGVLCVRCGVPLHPSVAHMVKGFDPPICRRCYWLVFTAH